MGAASGLNYAWTAGSPSLCLANLSTSLQRYYALDDAMQDAYVANVPTTVGEIATLTSTQLAALEDALSLAPLAAGTTGAS